MSVRNNFVVKCVYCWDLKTSSMKSTSVWQCINVVKLLHFESRLGNPLEGDWFLNTVMKGIDCLLDRTKSYYQLLIY